MRKLHHPKIEDITVEGILHALSDPVRMSIYIELAHSECTRNCSELSQIRPQPLPKSTLSQHFRILREAGLIYSERQGVELLNHTRCEELRGKFGDMVSLIINAYSLQIQKNPE